VTAYDPNFKTPYTETLAVSLTRQVTRSITVDLRYDGTLGRRRADTTSGAASLNANLANVYYNKELFDALEMTRQGLDAPLFDQMLAGLTLPGLPAGYAAVGTANSSGVVQHGSAQIRRSTSFSSDLAIGNYQNIANTLNTLSVVTAGLQP